MLLVGNMIESSQNKFFKEVKSLSQKKFVDKLNRFIIEGEKFIFDNLENLNILYFIISENYYNEKGMLKVDADVHILKTSLFEEIISTVNSQGIIAICEKFNYNINGLIEGDKSFVVICENIQDPGNLGTIIRTAECAGADFVVTTKGSVSLYNSKTIRSTAGAVFNIPIVEGIEQNRLVSILKENKIKILGTHLRSNKFYYETNLKEDIAIVIGNEGSGMSEEFTQVCDELLKIPIMGKSESLNAAIASSIILYDVVRQRKGE